jgi:hypothetical protein
LDHGLPESAPESFALSALSLPENLRAFLFVIRPALELLVFGVQAL